MTCRGNPVRGVSARNIEIRIRAELSRRKIAMHSAASTSLTRSITRLGGARPALDLEKICIRRVQTALARYSIRATSVLVFCLAAP